MYEPERQNAPVPVRTLEKQGFAAVANLAGGLFLLILSALGGRLAIVGIGLGVLAAIAGLVALASKDRADRKPGFILTAGGILAILSRTGAAFFRPLAGTLLSVGAFGLIALGIWNGIKFIKGLRSRS
ncbi:MAG: hypothetical protein LBQ46_08500 [Treponema sp.]|jgi:hypothetical protein|nr:hypothetical protein [Treponema sp.]